MGDTNENLLRAVRHYQENLDKYSERKNDDKMLHCMDRLSKLPIKVTHLEQTGVGRTVNALRKIEGRVGDAARTLISQWKKMVVGEQQEEEQAEQEDDDEDEDEGIMHEDDNEEESNQSSSSDDDEGEKHISYKNSSRRDSDRTKIENKGHKHRHNSSKIEHKNQKKEKEKHKANGHSSTSSSNSTTNKYKVRNQDSDSDSGRKKLKNKDEISSDDEEVKHKSVSNIKQKRRHTETDDATSSKKSKRRRHDSEKKYKLDGDVKLKTKSIKKEHHKQHKHEYKKNINPDSGKIKDKYSKYSSSKQKSEKKEKLKTSKISSDCVENGIDSGSGASFAEALGMCGPSSSKAASKPRKPVCNNLEKTEKANASVPKEKVTKVLDNVPKLLKEPTVDPVDINISSLLPPITPNYRPLGNIFPLDNQSKKTLSDYEQLSNIIASKTQRTKVYSGNKTGNGKVPTLYEICIRVLQDNIDALEYTGGVPYIILKPILDKATPNQLFTMEHHNPYLIEDTDELWQLHCQKDFRNKKREEMESWREMYMRCLDEREAKLKALTANIKQAQDKSLPVRTTKLAYVDDVVKPPRNIARKQAKNGTAFDKKPFITPSARLTTIATSGEAGKVVVPNPGARAAERSSNHHPVKPKKAPLMAKSLSLLKNRFRR